jgi:hypothetical protein
MATMNDHDELAVMRSTDVAQAIGIILDMRPGPARRQLVLAKMLTAVAIQAYHIGVVECWECLFTPAGDPCWRCTPFTVGGK